MSLIRIKNIILISAIIALFFVMPVCAEQTITVEERNAWDDYNQITCTGSISGGNVTSWELDFGDDGNVTGTGESISETHTYTISSAEDLKDYTVSLSVDFDDNSTDTGTATATIEEPDLVASADIDVDDEEDEITVSSDTDGADSYEWDFGDGYSYSSSSTSHIYSAPGIYNVTLTVTSLGGQTDDYQEDVNITAPTATATATATASLDPNAYFTVDYDEGNADLYVRFTDGSTVNTNTESEIDYWYWDFNSDGTIDYTATTEANADVEHTFSSVGTYTVTLTVEDEDGYEDSYDYEIEVVYDDEAPTAGFSVDDSAGTAPFTVEFTDESEPIDPDDEYSEIDGWYWEFYDEDNDDIDVINSTYQNPEIEFEEAGVYTVRLTVEEDGICSTIIEEDAITVTSSLSATFSASPASGTVPLTVTFRASDGAGNDYDIDTYYWSFGDGSTGVGKTVTHVYSSAATYSVTLKVTDEEWYTYTTPAKTITVNPKSTTPSMTYAIETTATVTQTEAATVDYSSAGTKIFGLPGTEFFRGEMDRYYDFYKEWTSLLAGILGMG